MYRKTNSGNNNFGIEFIPAVQIFEKIKEKKSEKLSNQEIIKTVLAWVDEKAKELSVPYNYAKLYQGIQEYVKYLGSLRKDPPLGRLDNNETKVPDIGDKYQENHGQAYQEPQNYSKPPIPSRGVPSMGRIIENEMNAPDYGDKYQDKKGPRCQICHLPMIFGPDTKILYGCPGCGRSFILHENEWITIEDYLDPDQILQFENEDGFGPEYQKILQEEKKQRGMGGLMAKMGIVVNHLEAYRPWADRMFQCMQAGEMEEALFTAVKALHDYFWNYGFWLNVAQMAAGLWMFDVAKRAIRLVQIMDPNYEALNRIRERLQMFEMMSKPMIDQLHKSPAIIAVTKLAEDNLRCGKVDRAIYRLKENINLDPNESQAWVNLGVCYLQKSEMGEADAAFSHAVELNPTDPMIYFNMINLANFQDDIKKAEEYARKAVELAPDNERFQQKLRDVLTWGSDSPVRR